MKLTRLVIHKYRNVVPGTTLEFSRGQNVLLGKNATGKTTLLNLLAAVASADFSGLEGEEFSLEYEVEAPECRLQASVRNERIDPWKSVPLSLKEGALGMLGPAAGGHRWTSTLRFAFPSHPEVIQVEISPSGIIVTLETPAGNRSIKVEDRSSVSHNVLLSSFLMAMQLREGKDDSTLQELLIRMLWVYESAQIRFDESLGFFERICSEDVVLRQRGPQVDYLHGSPGASYKMVVRIAEAASTPDSSDRTTLSFPSEQVPFLKAAVEQMGFEAGTLKVERIEKGLEADGEEKLRFGNFSFDFTREDGSAIHHSLLSFGQKRLLAFYYYLDACPHVAIVDELVNGLHHRWIAACMDALGDRQAFLTSQNPLLLDHLSFESAEHVRSSFILCSMQKRDKHEQLVWANMPEEEAERFFTAYQAGIQHVSEILRTKGLW